jgi:pre-mRNA-splicing factor CDC5/CEF1
LINLEVAALMKHDSVAHPLPGSAAPAGGASEYDMPEDDYVALAKSAIHGELASSMGLPGANADQLRVAISATVDPESDSFTHSWAASSSSYITHPSLGTVSPADLTSDERDVAYRHMISATRERMIASATTAAKAEKKLAKQFGGYMALNAKAKSGCAETIEKIHQARRDLETFGMLRAMEEAGAPARVERKREEVNRLERREGDLQARYAELLDERRELQRDVEKVGL